MKLYVDDIRMPPDDSWTLARTATAAIKALAQFHFDEISLDHDISHQVIIGRMSRPYPCEETYQAVAHFIGMKHKVMNIEDTYRDVPVVTNDGYKPPIIHVHSSNPVGGEEIVRILADYGLEADFVRSKPANRLETIV